MRHILVVAFVFLAGSIAGDAQEFKKDRTSPLHSRVSADRWEDIDGGMRLSGNVTITVAGGTVTADSAIVRPGGSTIELAGHVQLKMGTPAK